MCRENWFNANFQVFFVITIVYIILTNSKDKGRESASLQIKPISSYKTMTYNVGTEWSKLFGGYWI